MRSGPEAVTDTFFQQDVEPLLHPFRAPWASPGRASGAQDASEAPQERSQTLLETHFGRLWGALGAFLNALGPFWSAQRPLQGLCRVFAGGLGAHFQLIFDVFS